MKTIKSILNVIIKILLMLFVINVFCFILFGYGIMAGYGSGESMKPTISEKNITVIVNYPGLIDNLNRSDIVSWQNGKKQLTKRVIAFPGETIEIKLGKTYINGEEYIEDYIIIDKLTYTYCTLSEDEYFIMGDNRPNSNDSRFFGPVKKEGFLGINIWNLMIPE